MAFSAWTAVADAYDDGFEVGIVVLTCRRRRVISDSVELAVGPI